MLQLSTFNWFNQVITISCVMFIFYMLLIFVFLRNPQKLKNTAMSGTINGSLFFQDPSSPIGDGSVNLPANSHILMLLNGIILCIIFLGLFVCYYFNGKRYKSNYAFIITKPQTFPAFFKAVFKFFFLGVFLTFLLLFMLNNVVVGHFAIFSFLPIISFLVFIFLLCSPGFCNCLAVISRKVTGKGTVTRQVWFADTWLVLYSQRVYIYLLCNDYLTPIILMSKMTIPFLRVCYVGGVFGLAFSQQMRIFVIYIFFWLLLTVVYKQFVDFNKKLKLRRAKVKSLADFLRYKYIKL